MEERKENVQEGYGKMKVNNRICWNCVSTEKRGKRGLNNDLNGGLVVLLK